MGSCWGKGIGDGTGDHEEMPEQGQGCLGTGQEREGISGWFG